MKLLISPLDEKEAIEAFTAGADIIDVKNPIEGSLGADFPWIIKHIREITPKEVEVSCAIGDVPNLPGSIALAALGAATTGIDYIKTGLYGLRNKKDAVYLMSNVARAVKEFDPTIKVVAAGYADAARVGSVHPLLIPEIAQEAQADLAMVDTAIKDGKNLFDFLTVDQTRNFVNKTHELGLKVALAGALKKEDLPLVYSLGTDVAGIRGAACTQGDRFQGRITREKVRELVDIVRLAEIQEELEN